MGVNIQTIKDIRFYLARELEGIYHTKEISAISNIIIKTVLDVTKLHGLSVPEQSVNREQAGRMVDICNELKTGKPIQYILGETFFYDCVIKVTSDTLIPRQETEELVDLIISENRGFQGKILDLGTGSGCIAISLAKNLTGASITGIDISENAIRVAQENALINNVPVSFKKGDILNLNFDVGYKTGIIVSNPPYVRNSEKQLMSKNVLDFEPGIALFVPDSDPLLYFKAILKVTDKILGDGGRLYFEINEAMGKSMFHLLDVSGYSEVEIITDINNKDRIIKGTKNG